MMQRVFGHYFLAVIFICINASFRGSWKYPECESKGIGTETRERGKAARQALKEADIKPFLNKSPAQF